MAGLALFVDVDAPAECTWAAAVDWARQGEWMLGTGATPTYAEGGCRRPARRVHRRRAAGLRRSDGDHTVATTAGLSRGAHRLGRPRHRCGQPVHWREDLDLLLGLLRRVGWVLVRPLFAYGVKLSLRRFARRVATTLPT